MFFCNQIKCLKRGAVPVFPGLFPPQGVRQSALLWKMVFVYKTVLSLYIHTYIYIYIYIYLCVFYSL